MFCTLTMIAFLTFTKRYHILKWQIDGAFYKAYLVSYVFANLGTYALLVILIVYKQYWNKYFLQNSPVDWMPFIYHAIYPQMAWILPIKMYHNEIVQYVKFITSHKSNISGIQNLNLNVGDNIHTTSGNLYEDKHQVKQQLQSEREHVLVSNNKFTCVTLQSIDFWQQSTIVGSFTTLLYDFCIIVEFYGEMDAMMFVVVALQILVVLVIFCNTLCARKALRQQMKDSSDSH